MWWIFIGAPIMLVYYYIRYDRIKVSDVVWALLWGALFGPFCLFAFGWAYSEKTLVRKDDEAETGIAFGDKEDDPGK